MSFRIPFQSNKSGLQSLKLDIIGYMMEVNRTKKWEIYPNKTHVNMLTIKTYSDWWLDACADMF